MDENPVEKAIRDAEASCQAAVTSTPQQYREFLVLIPQSKRVGGSRQNPIYANIRLPYMAVDGRVRMAQDEHRAAGAMLTIETSFESIGEKLACKAVVASALLGTRVGHSFVNFDGSGVDKTNPIENAETSAVGRALGFMGYGLFGTGIASAEEVIAAMGIRAGQGTGSIETEAIPEPEPQPATQKQLGFLYSLLKGHGVLDGDERLLVDFLYPNGLAKDDATQLIDHIKTQGTLPAYISQGYIRMWTKTRGKDRQEVGAYMDKAYGHHDPAKLNNAQFALLVEHIAANGPVAEEEPDDIYLPGELVKDVSVLEWMDLTRKICESCEITTDDLRRWVLHQFSNGSVEDISMLPKEVYHSLDAMDRDYIKEQVIAHHTVDDKQGVLVS